MGVLKRLTEEYFGETERKEDMIKLPAGVVRVDFTDRNGKRHKNGYRVVDGSGGTLMKLIKKLVDKRGLECDLNDVDVSNVRNMSYMFLNSHFNGDISGWDVSGVIGMYCMFFKSAFTGENGDISGWEPLSLKSMFGIFNDSPLENNPPEWYRKRMR